jgi:hydroxymethylbilane synthase
LCISAIPKREDPRDVLVSRDNLKLNELPEGAIVGVSSVRRADYLKKLRSDFEFKPIRGNIDERIKKVEEGLYDAIILAAAGLKRLGLHDKIAEYFEIKDFAPAPGQGALAVITRINDEKMKNIVKVINHEKDAKNALKERNLQVETVI